MPGHADIAIEQFYEFFVKHPCEEWVASFKYYKTDGALTLNDYDNVLKDFHVVNEAVMKLQTALRPRMKHMIAIGNIDFFYCRGCFALRICTYF